MARPEPTPFTLIGPFVTVPVTVDGAHGTFILDTGIGVTLLSTSFALAVGCVADGSTYTGRRMSGQAVEVPLGMVKSLELGTTARPDLLVGIIDLVALEGVDGFLSLEFFRDTPFTVDYAATAVLVESEESLSSRVDAGVCLDVRSERDGPALTVFLPFAIPGGPPIEVEIDMGSDVLILDEALAPRVGVDLHHDAVRTVEGTDETGHAYARHFTTIRGSVGPADAASVRQVDPDVMFQRIIHDGLVGHAFLRNFAVTYDLPRSRVILGG